MCIILSRYFSLYGYAVDAIDEDGAILILVRDKSKAGEDSLDKECESANVQVDKSSVIQGPDSPLGKFATAARETIMDVEYRVQQEEKAAVQCIIHQATFVIRPGKACSPPFCISTPHCCIFFSLSLFSFSRSLSQSIFFRASCTWTNLVGIHPDSLEHGKHSNQRNAPSDSEKRNYTTIEIGSSFDPQVRSGADLAFRAALRAQCDEIYADGPHLHPTFVFCFFEQRSDSTGANFDKLFGEKLLSRCYAKDGQGCLHRHRGPS